MATSLLAGCGATILSGLVLAVSGAAAAAVPGRDVGPEPSGGAGGEHVTVSTRAALEQQLCRTRSGSACTDDAPRTIEVVGTIDFRGTEGSETSPGCFYDPHNPTKALLTIVDPKSSCVGIAQRPIAYDKAGRDPLLVGSNKTVIGHDATAIIKGRGLALRHVRNVIVRNLTITEINPAVIWAGDALDMSDVSDILIDHDRFSLVGRQMVVGHFGRQQTVTLSWNVFDGRTPYYVQGHYWNILFTGDGPTNVTILHNWFLTFSGRSPALHGGGTFDIANNLFEDGHGHALELNDVVDVLLEGNAFEKVDQLIVAKGGTLYAPTNDDASQRLCSAALHRRCEPNRIAGAKTTQGFKVDPGALTAFAGSLPVPDRADAVVAIVRRGAGPH